MSESAYEVKRSVLHGRGLFARRAIRKGELIGLAEGVRVRRDGPHVLWLIDDDGSEEGWRITNDLRFVNHDSPANAHFENLELHAVAHIPAGAEITFDYGTLVEDDADEAGARRDGMAAGALE